MKISDCLYPAKGAQLLPGYTKDDMEQVTVMIQNEILKKKKFDHRTVDALFVKLSHDPGVQIFILEPTRNDLRNCHFTVDENTTLTIYACGWVYRSFKIVLTSKPSHPIVYAKLIGYDVPKDPATISFDLMRYKERAFTIKYAPDHTFKFQPFFDQNAEILFNESDYMIGEIWDPNSSRKHIPVHMKNLDGFRRIIDDSFVHTLGVVYEEEINPKNFGYSESTKVGFLETYNYFNRLRYYPDAGFHFFDGAYEYEVLSLTYLDNPCYPILNLGRLDHQLLSA